MLALLLSLRLPTLAEPSYITILPVILYKSTAVYIRIDAQAGFVVIQQPVHLNVGFQCRVGFTSVSCDQWHYDPDSEKSGGVYVLNGPGEVAYLELFAADETAKIDLIGGVIHNERCGNLSVLSNGNVSGIAGTQACLVPASDHTIIEAAGELTENQTIQAVTAAGAREVGIGDKVMGTVVMVLDGDEFNGSVGFSDTTTDVNYVTLFGLAELSKVSSGVIKLVENRYEYLEKGYWSKDGKIKRWMIWVITLVLVSAIVIGAMGLIVRGCCVGRVPRPRSSSSSSTSERRPMELEDYAPRQPGLEEMEEADFVATQKVEEIQPPPMDQPHYQADDGQEVAYDPPRNPYETPWEQGF